MTVANFLQLLPRRRSAADRPTRCQPSRFNALENELGVKLFHRTSKSVRLTQAGYLFTQYADEILRISGLSKERLKAAQEVHSVRLGCGIAKFCRPPFDDPHPFTACHRGAAPPSSCFE